MTRATKKTNYKTGRAKVAIFDWDDFLRKAAGRVLKVGDLPTEVREAVANGDSAAVAEFGYTIGTAALWPEYLSGDQLVFWPEDKSVFRFRNDAGRRAATEAQLARMRPVASIQRMGYWTTANRSRQAHRLLDRFGQRGYGKKGGHTMTPIGELTYTIGIKRTRRENA